MKGHTIEIFHETTWTGQRKETPEREPTFFLTAAQNNAIRSKLVKANIDKTQKNSNCRLCGDRDETINHIIKESCKLALKEYKTRHEWVGKVVH